MVFFPRIVQSPRRMKKSVQPMRIYLVTLVPVVQEIIVEQCPLIKSLVLHLIFNLSRMYKLAFATLIQCSCTDIFPCWIYSLVLLKLSDSKISFAYFFNSYSYICFLPLSLHSHFPHISVQPLRNCRKNVSTVPGACFNIHSCHSFFKHALKSTLLKYVTCRNVDPNYILSYIRSRKKVQKKFI